MKTFHPLLHSNRSVVARHLCALMCGALLGLDPLTVGRAQASKKAEKAADSLKALAKTVQQGEAELTEVTRALDQLCNKPNKDLRKPFKAYEKAVKKLSTLAADARKRRDGLNQNRAAYLAAWDQDLAAIQQEDIRTRSQERRQKVQEELEMLSKLSAEVGQTYQAYEAQLLQIQRALGADLTPGGVQAVAPIANQTRVSAVAVRDSLAKLRAELQRLGVAMSAKVAKRMEGAPYPMRGASVRIAVPEVCRQVVAPGNGCQDGAAWCAASAARS